MLAGSSRHALLWAAPRRPRRAATGTARRTHEARKRPPPLAAAAKNDRDRLCLRVRLVTLSSGRPLADPAVPRQGPPAERMKRARGRRRSPRRPITVNRKRPRSFMLAGSSRHALLWAAPRRPRRAATGTARRTHEARKRSPPLAAAASLTPTVYVLGFCLSSRDCASPSRRSRRRQRWRYHPDEPGPCCGRGRDGSVDGDRPRRRAGAVVGDGRGGLDDRRRGAEGGGLRRRERHGGGHGGRHRGASRPTPRD